MTRSPDVQPDLRPRGPRDGLLDGLSTSSLDQAVRLARFITASAYAAVHVLDDEFQHRVVAAGGAELGRTPRSDSMCAVAVDSRQRVYAPDATKDPRFAGSPFVSGDAPVRFYLAVPLQTPGGDVLGTLCAYDHAPLELQQDQLERFGDVAAQVATQLELARVAGDLAYSASHDELTGLPNRGLLHDRLQVALARRQDAGSALTVALLDLDGFKAVNDEHGHQAGDAVLVEVAGRLQAAVRAGDTVARLGGDEFVVLADGRDVALVERLRAAFSAPFALPSGGQVWLHSSVGAVTAAAEDLPHEVLARADAAMYRDKAVPR